MENIETLIHRFTICRRKTEFILPLHFAVQNDDEELNPILSRLEFTIQIAYDSL
jgi:hypothetical protein